MIYRAAAATCPGKKKSYNSNNFYLNSKYITEEFCSSQVLLTQKKDQKGLQLYAISEGFGADTYSEEASLSAMKTLFKFHGKKLQELAAAREAGKSTAGMDMVGFVNTYIQSANNTIKAKASNLGDDQLRATLAMICVKGKRVVTANLGNTRIYHFRNGLLQQISEDHTQAQKMVDAGMIPAERAAAHPKRHKLTQYMGIHSDSSPLNPAVFEMTAEAGDVFLICSHAFCESITAEDIQAILSKNQTAADIIDKLMAEVSETGFQEDTTLVVLTAMDTPKSVVDPASISGVTMASADVHTRPNTWRTEESTQEDRVASSRPVSKTSLFVMDEEKADPVAPVAPVRRRVSSRRTAKQSSGFMAKVKNFLGLDSDSPDAQIWPAVIVFALCLIIVILFIVLGYKYLSTPNDGEQALPSIPAASETVDASTSEPTQTPTLKPVWSPPPSTQPTATPSGTPTEEPSDIPSQEPSEEPSEEPTEEPSQEPSGEPTEEPSQEPSDAPTEEPTQEPSDEPTEQPSQEPSDEPTEESSQEPSGE
ncbi:MAG: PT domain-containing protein [Clostridia bacterium]|nr:PT domain-containing protein [Clostridia bacterium]